MGRTLISVLKDVGHLARQGPAMVAFVVLLALVLANSFAIYRLAYETTGGSNVSLGLIGTGLSIVIGLAIAILQFYLARQLGGAREADQPARLGRWIVLRLGYGFLVGLIASLSTFFLAMLFPTTPETFIYGPALIRIVAITALLAITLRLVGLARGDAAPRLAALFSYVWKKEPALLLGYAGLALGFALLSYGTVSLVDLLPGEVAPSDWLVLVRQLVAAIPDAAGSIATFLFAIAIYRRFEPGNPEETEVFA
jgi:hypothetical protein